MLKHSFFSAIIIAFLALLAYQVEAAPTISPGTPTTSVPTYLTDGSYLFGITVSLGTDEFLLPVEISGAAGLQNWQFDLLFDKTVVQEVDPGDGSSGIYGAEFTLGDLNSLSFILGGFPFNGLGEVDGVAGSYPSLLAGPSGDGPLAFIAFQFLTGQETNNPNFSIANASVLEAVPEPATLGLFIGGLLVLFGARRLAIYKRKT